jgi:hypothetical protein
MTIFRLARSAFQYRVHPVAPHEDMQTASGDQDHESKIGYERELDVESA